MYRSLRISEVSRPAVGLASIRGSRIVYGVAVGFVLVASMSACSWFRSSDQAPKGEMRTATDAPPKFEKPTYTGQGAPDLASVPNDVPTPPSTKQEREKIIEGLVADRERARYTDQESRIQPVNVRPLSEAAAEAEDEPTAPPQAKGAPVQPVTKMQTVPGKAATPDELAKLAASTPPPPPPPPSGAMAQAVGPAGPGSIAAGTPGPRASAGVVRSDGFRQLEDYGGSKRNRIAFVDFGFNSVTLTPADRRKLDDAAQAGKEKGSFRVVGRSNDASQKSQQRATAVARELQNAGIPQDRIYVGTDAGTEGMVEVMLDQ